MNLYYFYFSRSSWSSSFWFTILITWFVSFLTKSLRNLISVIRFFLLEIVSSSAKLLYLPSCDSSTLVQKFKVLQHQCLIIIFLYLPILLIIFYFLIFLTIHRLATSDFFRNWLATFYSLRSRVNWTYIAIFLFESQFFTTRSSLFSFSISVTFSFSCEFFWLIDLLKSLLFWEGGEEATNFDVIELKNMTDDDSFWITVSVLR